MIVCVCRRVSDSGINRKARSDCAESRHGMNKPTDSASRALPSQAAAAQAHERLPGVPRPTPSRRLNSAHILHGDGEVEIDHDGALYRLRVTALGKLILTK